MSQVIAIANQKGGVGKTTTAINLSAYLAQQGQETLLIDMDPQGNSTAGVGVEKTDLKHTIYNVLIDETLIEEAIVSSDVDWLDVVPANIHLIGAEIELVNVLARETRLRRALEKLNSVYKYIIIDCPPSLGLLTVNSLTAADSVIIPMQCEYYALEGLGQLLNTIELIRRNLNPGLKVEGVLLTMFDSRVNLSSQVVEEVRKYLKDKVYTTVIPRTVRLSEAPSHGKPILLYDPQSKGAHAYADLAKEVIGHTQKEELVNGPAAEDDAEPAEATDDRESTEDIEAAEVTAAATPCSSEESQPRE
jgi:chromosome partitioning protein